MQIEKGKRNYLSPFWGFSVVKYENMETDEEFLKRSRSELERKMEEAGIKPAPDLVIRVVEVEGGKLTERAVIRGLYPHEHKGSQHKGNMIVEHLIGIRGRKAVMKCVMPNCGTIAFLEVKD
ncbi:MAG TPA: hypothetical protein PK045_03055 [Candidatus Woesebacteria bacterium]|nr:hypothetical protein [Candidatus Woesebacteria bacterium]